ncbi:MAG: hypothetical protein M1376_01870 [Planctomycetes bacterium]|nr:hypothetical protein [Planctomycetota bacterium]
MTKNKRVSFYLEEQWLGAITGLADTFGVLYDAWKRAKASQPGYAIAQVDTETAGHKPSAGKTWAVLKDGRII